MVESINNIGGTGGESSQYCDKNEMEARSPKP